MRLYSILDRTAEEFCNPIVCKNDAVALRMFQQFLSNTAPHLHSDYALYYLASWDATVGVYDVLPAPSEILPLAVVEKITDLSDVK